MKRVICVFLIVYLCGDVCSKSSSKYNIPSYLDDLDDAMKAALSEYNDWQLRPVNLTLKRSPFYRNITEIPMWTVETKAGKSYNYRELSKEEKELNGTLLVDVDHPASLLAYNIGGRTYYDGFIGEGATGKVVKREQKIPIKNKQEIKNFLNDTNDGYDAGDHKKERFTAKILVVVDNKLFKILGENIKKTVRYVVTFMNAVNNQYHKMEDPIIKVVMAGLIIEKDVTALDFFYKARQNSGYFNNELVLGPMGKYFEGEFQKTIGFRNYHAVYLMTNMKANGALGFAYLRGVCRKKSNTAWSHDAGSYSGVTGAVHEIGHLMSLEHDSKEESGCHQRPIQSLSFLLPMGGQDYGQRVIWSECSKRKLKEFLKSKDGSCLKDE